MLINILGILLYSGMARGEPSSSSGISFTTVLVVAIIVLYNMNKKKEED